MQDPFNLTNASTFAAARDPRVAPDSGARTSTEA